MDSIVLIGFMGTGKTQVGRRLATRLGWPFLDTDRLIEDAAGMKVEAIFENEGEAGFRVREKDAIRRATHRRPGVIATGGGAVVDPENLSALRSAGRLICLEATPSEIERRVAESKRPLLAKGKRSERIRELMTERAPFYEKAEIRIDTTGRSVGAISGEILKRLKPERTVTVNLGTRSYPIEIGPGILASLGERMARLGLRGKAAVVSNPRVAKLYGGEAAASLKAAGFTVTSILIPDGERYKTVRSVERVYDQLIKNRFERGSVLVALGGGVIGDLTGYAAATFLRGIPFVQIPTTLAAQVDASIGGKTGVNHPSGKNLIGAFHQPRLVLVDPGTLASLPPREFQSGLAEVIKYGVIADAEFFGFLDRDMAKIRSRDPEALLSVLARSCEIKADVVSRDETEGDIRRILNYGHTLGHAIESLTGYRKYLHGEAVAMGMAFAAELSKALGLCSAETVSRQKELIQAAGLPVALPDLKTGNILRSMKLDKKVVDASVTFVLCEAIGKVAIQTVEEPVILSALKTAYKKEE